VLHPPADAHGNAATTGEPRDDDEWRTRAETQVWQ
jgi:hypothetical protein